LATLLGSRLAAFYKVRGAPASIEARALAIAVEQSVEMPLAAIDDRAVRADIVGQVAAIEDCGDGWFDVRIDLAAATIGDDAGQLINMLFGNTSLHDDVILHDIVAPESLLAAFGGPRHGLEGLRQRAMAQGRALTCSALKPQGLPASKLAELAFRLALGGLDFIKDDHGLANQSYSPFSERVRACASAIRKAAAISGRATRYAPSLSGSYPEMERQLAIARDEGIDTVLIGPMIAGVSNFHALRRANPDFAFLAHPTMTGAVRVSPILFAKLFRLFGADAVIFPNHGGRFGYSAATCAGISDALRCVWDGLRPSAPAPAGGMTVRRAPEMLDFYGAEVMLLIGGGLLEARDAITATTADFVRAVAEHDYGRLRS
jgi:ribulose-bisphosphate carboxylase large chain